MKIAGVQKNSFVDFPGKVAMVLFTPGCNLDCFYCHNRSIIREDGLRSLWDPEEVFSLLGSRKKFLDAVVISGGEPTLQKGLEEFIGRIKELGFLVKLDTNGTRPGVVERLLSLGLIDYIAMDIKAPLQRYEEICGVAVDLSGIRESVDLLLKSRVSYEFRTTLVPQLKEEDVVAMAKWIQGAKRYILQQYKRPPLESETVDVRIVQAPHSPSFIRKMAETAGEWVEYCGTRGVA